MARFTFIDNGLPFDGRAPDLFPIGGAEGAVVSLAEALAARGHHVTVLNRCVKPLLHNGVQWAPLDDSRAPPSDLFVVNRDPGLLKHVPDKKRAVLWLHNNARYLSKWRHAIPLLRFRPKAVLLSGYHATTLPALLHACPPQIIPLGIDPSFSLRETLSEPPPPRAVFASNPNRGLTELLDLWAERIHSAVPQAELHLFTRADFYGAHNKSARQAEPIIARAAAMRSSHNVILHDMVPRSELAGLYRTMRTMLYWGDTAQAETYCLSIAEAQASGVPCVARPIGALPERLGHGRTGFLAGDETSFAAAATALLTDDVLWRDCHRRAVADRPSSWDAAAARFELLHA